MLPATALPTAAHAHQVSGHVTPIPVELCAQQVVEASTGWTNFAELAPLEAFASVQTVLATASGFLVPGRSTGSVDLFVIDGADSIDVFRHANRTKVSTDRAGWFYHKLAWHDCNRDGRLDVIAARA